MDGNSPNQHKETTESALRDIARRLAAYIPSPLARRILEEGLPTPGEPRSFTAATLFSDITGFAAMADRLAGYGPRGAEELNRVLLQTFTAMINAIQDAGGTVSHFYGDAMAVYFPDDNGRAAEHALACARFMQSLMQTSFRQVVTYRQGYPPTIFDLSMRIGVSYGRCVEFVVGDPDGVLEFVVAGQAVDEAASAQMLATPGQTVASRTVLEQAGLPADRSYRLLTEWLRMPAPMHRTTWEAYSPDALQRLIDVMAAFIPSAIYERLTAVDAHFVAEHRPATSLFVRFTGIDFDADNAGNLLQLYYEWMRKVVSRYGGENSRLNRVIVGDKGNYLHIIFGAPMAPDAPEQALRCALALQRERPAFLISQQIGLAGGKVFAGPVGSQNRREYTIVGDVVNLSSRLAQVCPDGYVLTDVVTANRVRASIEFERLPAVPLKGKKEPVPLYRAIGSRADVTRLEKRFDKQAERVVGRQKELDMILGGMDAALRGIGGMAAIGSPAGVGSARLLAKAVQDWLKAGGIGYYGVGQPHTADVPYSIWHNVWRDFCGLHNEMTPREQAGVIWRRIDTLYPAGREDASLWGEAMGAPMRQTARLALLNAEARRSRLFPLIRNCFRAVAESQPIMIVLEDVQWADNLSLDMMADLAEHLGDLPVFVALTYRTDADFKLPFQAQPNCVPIILSDLPPHEARQLMQQVIGESNLPLAVEQHLGLRDRNGRSTPVNSLFLEEALKMMLERGVLQTNGRLRVNEELLDQMPVPETIYTLLLARLDHLGAAARNLLQVASVIGRQFDLETLLNTIGDVSRERIEELLDDLVATQMIQLVTSQPQPTYIFQQAMIHEVVYGSLPYARRHLLHAAVADWLAARHASNLKPIKPLLAYHYGRTEQHNEALEYAVAAANDAYAILANQEAVDLYSLAESHLTQIGVDTHWAVATHIYLSRGYAHRLMGDFGAALADARQALDLAQKHSDVGRMARALNLATSLHYQQARHAQALTLANQIIETLAEEIPPDELARAHMWAGMAASAQSDYNTALMHLRQSERICGDISNHQRLARVLSAIALIHYARQEPQAALATMRRAVELARDFGSPAQIGLALYHVAQAQLRLGQAESALTSLMEVIRLARGASRSLLARGLTSWGEVLAYLGRFGEAHVVFEEAANLFSMMDDERGLVEVYLLWGYECHCPQEQWDEARRCLALAQQIIRKQPDQYPVELARLFLAMAQTDVHDGRAERAKRFLLKAESLCEQTGQRWWLPAVRYWRAKALLALEDVAAARVTLLEARQAALMQGSPDYLPLIFLELAQLAEDDEKRRVFLERCIDAAKARSRHHDRVYCLETAAALLAAGQITGDGVLQPGD